MSLREWLIAIGSLIILGVVVDGIRRMRRARKESVAISSGMGADDLDPSPLDNEFNPELPNGGARTISRNSLEERGYVKPERKSSAQTQTKPTRPVYSSKSPEPVLEPEPEQQPFSEAPFGASRDEPDVSLESGWGADGDDRVADAPVAGEDDGILGEARVVKTPSAEQAQTSARESQNDKVREAVKAPPDAGADVQKDTANRGKSPDKEGQPLAGANRPEAREVVVINVLAKNSERFDGDKLKALFDACGLQHGDLDIYHRHEQSDTYSPVQFSVASAVEPGIFKPNEISTFSTPGISFFMSMPGPTNSLQAFEFMLETAQCVVRNLGGDLKDERRSVMTPQTIEHCRQRIREFERKKRSSA